MKVEIIHTNEIGEWFWAVQILNTEIWLDAFDFEQDAVEYCEKCGHSVIRIVR